MKHIKRMFSIILIIISLFLVFMVNGLIESMNVNKQLSEFKARGEYVDQIGNTIYYQVKKKYKYEDVSRHIKEDIRDKMIGSTGDIYVTSRNPIPGNPIFGLISKLTWIGHTALVITDDGTKTIEITGNLSPEENVVQIWPNVWVGDSTTKQIALLRVKNTTVEQRKKIVDYAKSQIGTPYNYTFLFNRANSFYCSDFVSRSIAHAGINVNYDYLATTGSDLIVSKNTYLAYYRERIDDGKFAVYYLTKGD